MKIVCFLSDFGLTDDFVGTCRGVMAGISPSTTIVDLTHDVPGFRVEAGAEILRHATRYMPTGTIYLAVVDPGVGTKRRGLALRAGDSHLVGPDNGLLIPAAEALGGISSAVALTNPDYQIHPVSNTFHGRDVFAPAAAHLAAGVAVEELGDALSTGELRTISVPEAGEDDGEGGFLASILSVDRYGNARLSVMQENANLEYGQTLHVDAGDGKMSVRYVETFGSAKAGELILVPDSHWRLSLAVNQGNAAKALALGVGGRVRLFLAPDDAAT
jgi:S-adenosyl-L-methionine hydrolase (adenosine-forming)